MDVSLFMDILFDCLLVIILVGLIYLIVELIRTVMVARRVMQRVELLSDIQGWLSFIRNIPKMKKKTK